MEKRPLLSHKIPPVNRPLLASFLASIMSFASGTVVAGWSTPDKPNNMGEILFSPITMEQSSWIVSIYVFGALVGALPASQLSLKLGCKKLLLLLAVPMTIGWLMIMFFVDDVYLIYIGRLFCGLSLGAVSVAVPQYNFDIAPDVCRGRGGVFLDFMLCAGILYSYAASAYVGLVTFSFTCSLIPVVFAALFWFMPESPYHLYRIGQYAEAKSSLIWLRGKDFDVAAEFDKIARFHNESDDCMAELLKGTDSKEKKATFIKAVVLSLCLATVQRMSGAGAIIQFTSKLFQISGSTVRPITASIITGIFELIGAGVSIALIDKVGRRKLLLVSSSVVVICLIMLTAYFYYLTADVSTNIFKTLPVFIVCTYIAFFRIGLGPIPWFMSTELLGGFDETNRAQSYIASYSWLLSFVVMKSFLPLVNEWPTALWLGYSIISVIGFVFILFFIPETNNKNKNEINNALSKNIHVTF